jgi:hypothetical protein
MAETGKTDGAVQALRRQLERMGQELEAVSAEIWRNIDHNDPAGLDEGVAYKQRFNQSRLPLDAAVADMVAVLREYPRTDPGSGEVVTTPKVASVPASPPSPAPAAQPVAHPAASRAAVPPARESSAEASVADDLGQKVPFGFVLGGQTFTSASAWPLFYEAVLEELYERAAEKLSRLADEASGFLRGGKPLFARLPDRLSDPLPVAEALFAEADLSPEDLIEVIKGLLREVGYPLDSFKILLKEKNRGTVETLSLAA